MGDIDSFEEQLAIGLSDDPDIPSDVKEAGVLLKQEISGKAEHLPMLIENFLAFKRQTTQRFALGVLIPRLKLWAFLEENLIEPIRVLLFESAFTVFDSWDEDTKKVFANAQSQFSIHQYPNSWEDMWDFIFNIPNQSIIQHFLCAFCFDIILPTPALIEHFADMKQHIKNSGAEERIFAEVARGMHESNPLSFSALASFCHWANLSFIDDDNFKQTWALGFDAPTTASSAADICTALISRSMPIEQKVALMQNFNVIGLLEQICSNFTEQTDILRSSALACSTAGRLFLEYMEQVPEDLLHQIFEFSLQLLESPSDEVSCAVTNFLYTYTQRFSDVMPVFNSIMKRLALYFDDLVQKGKCSLNVLGGEFGKIASVCISKNPEDFFSALVESIGENPLENPSATAAVLFALHGVPKTSQDWIEPILSLLDNLKPIMEISPPFDPLLFFPIFWYLRLPTQLPPVSFPRELVPTFFASVISFATSSDLPEVMRAQFGKMLNLYVRAFRQQLEVPADLVTRLAETLNADMVSTAAGLIPSLVNDQQAPTISSCLAFFRENCSQSREAFYAACLFPSALNSGFLIAPEAKADLAAFLQEMIANCGEDSELISLVVKGIGALGADGFPMFQEWVFHPNFTRDRYTITGISECAIYFWQLGKDYREHKDPGAPQNELLEMISSNQWLGELANLLCDPFINEGKTILNGSIIPEQEVTQVVVPLFRSTLALMGIAVGTMDEEARNNILVFITLMFEARYDADFCFEAGIRCLNKMGEAQQGKLKKLIAEEFTKISMNFLFAPKFDPNSSRWERLIMRSLKPFQKSFEKAGYQAFSVALGECLKRFGVDDEFVNHYLVCLERDSRQAETELHLLFNQLMLARCGNTWE